MYPEEKRQWIARGAAGGIIGLAVLTPLGGLFNDIVSGGLIAMGGHTPFRLVSSELVWLVGSAPLALVIQLVLYFALGAALGCKQACPHREVVALLGDGSLGMTLGELETIAREKLQSSDARADGPAPGSASL